MLAVIIEEYAIRIGQRFAVSFHRTLRIPDDGRTYPLPPGLGMFPLFPEKPPVERETGSVRFARPKPGSMMAQSMGLGAGGRYETKDIS